ncbi:MAG TPA: alpha/beta hydrolase-fold protein [Plantibacter sp.]|uniref:alpha/beta hydrolase n=1 Tax=unclassified Plantibacter TaxID=2624265 RepID=UPI002D1E12E0|nr:alpha/beta hydrolase-fold protein [Plantibacter sp.]
MFDWVLSFRVDSAGFLIGCALVAAGLTTVLVVRRGTARSRLLSAVAVVAGAGLGYLLCWLLGDVLNVFGIDLTPTTRAWSAVAFAGVSLAIVSLVRARAWRIVVAGLAIPAFLLVGAVGINQDFGEFTTVGSALGVSPYESFSALPSAHGTITDWRVNGALPRQGKVEQVDIPATHSGFAHRAALVYLPPAALTVHPPALPVIEAFSGQPGQPADLFRSGDLAGLLDQEAATHHGLAPIVVVPDQLGAPDRNPMCVDGPLGNSATYLTKDVPDWIRTHLPVATDRADWFVAGFSQGGTCAIQFGAAHPELFGGVLDISGEVEPTIGPNTVAVGFSGSAAAYAAARPLSILSSKAPYPNTVALFGYGSDDSRYAPGVVRVAAAAGAAGMSSETFVSQGTAHDWHTVRAVLSLALPSVLDRFGIR